MATPNWTTGQVKTLTRMRESGARCEDIGAALGGRSKNSVIGMVHRLMLKPRRVGVKKTFCAKAVTPAPAIKTPKAARPTSAKPIKIITGSRGSPCHVVFEKEYAPNATSLGELRKEQCRWPLGDPLKPDFKWCGNDRMADCSYCEQHRQMASNKKQYLEEKRAA